MNERIKELAEQAGFSEVLMRNGFLVPLERFTELIILECAEQCTTNGPFGAEVIWGKQFHKKILEHFGVE